MDLQDLVRRAIEFDTPPRLPFWQHVARKLGTTPPMEPGKETLPDNEEATQNRWISRPRRKGYDLPQLL